MKLKTLLFAFIIVFAGTLNAQEENNKTSENITKKEKTEETNTLNEEIENGNFDNDEGFYGIHFKDNEDNFTITFRDNSKHKKYKQYKPRTRFKFDLDFGWDGYYQEDKDKAISGDDMEIDMWPSMYFGFSFNGKTRLFKEKSPLHVKYGLGLQWSNYYAKGDTYLEKENGAPVYKNDPVRNLEKSRIRNLYMTLPVMLQMDFSKNRMDTGFKFGVGAYGGVRFCTWQTVFYKDIEGDKTKQMVRNKYFMNPFSYGLQAEIGYGAFSVVGKYELSELFESSNIYNYHVWNLGAKFSF